MYDLIVRNGLLYGRRDGRNGAAADIAIVGGKICKIAPHIQERGVREIDVQGKFTRDDKSLWRKKE